jgi:hypothetical protein
MAPIHEAAKAGDVAALRRELEAGVAPDLGDVYNSTPLCLAMTYIGPLNKEAATACCAMLIEHRASVLLCPFPVRGPPMRFAINRWFDTDIPRMLLDAGAKVTMASNGNYAVLCHASGNCSVDLVTALLSAGAGVDIDARDPSRCTPLLRAVYNRHRGVVPALLRAGATIPSEAALSRWEASSRFLVSSLASVEYIRTVGEAGGVADKFPALPIECISHVVLLWAHCGNYQSPCCSKIAIVGARDRRLIWTLLFTINIQSAPIDAR